VGTRPHGLRVHIVADRKRRGGEYLAHDRGIVRVEPDAQGGVR
jgi:hypothetical protein